MIIELEGEGGVELGMMVLLVVGDEVAGLVEELKDKVGKLSLVCVFLSFRCGFSVLIAISRSLWSDDGNILM